MRMPFYFLINLILMSSCGFSTAENDGDAGVPSEMEQVLADAVRGTPYAALIQNTATQAEPLPDEDPEDDYALQRWTITARVLETYRGAQKATVQYTVDTEKNEELGLGDEPFIIVLCQSANGLYWPGVGYNFPAGEHEKALVRKVAEQVDATQAEFSECI